MIKLFISDVDSTLTDGIYQTSEDGVVSKNFYTRDFHGMCMIRETGVKICIITAANDEVIVQQCKRSYNYEIIKGSKNKYNDIRKAYVDNGPMFDWDEICYIGDDVFDIELLDAVGVAACPIDADISILNIIRDRSDGFVSSFSGGQGCVREFVDYISRANESENKNNFRK